MKKTALFLMMLAALFLVMGCGGKAADETKKDGEGGSDAKTEKKDLSPTETMKGFMDAFKKGGTGLDEAVKFMTEKAGKGFKGIIEIENEEPPEFSKIDYGEEKVDGEKATVMVTTVRKKKDGEDKTEKLTFHLEKADGKWCIIGLAPEGRKLQRFDDEKLLADIEEMKKMKEEKDKGSEKK